MELSTLMAELVERGLAETEDLQYSANPDAYNAALAKLLGQLKKEKELGITGVRLGYRGTGKQAHRRQIWLKMPDHERGGPDVWLESGYIKIGGVIDVPRSIPAARKYDADPPQAIYRWVVDTLKQQKAWYDAKYQNPQLQKPESIMDKPMNTKLEALRAELESHLDEGQGLRVGTIRMWKAGKYQKTSTGWVPVQASVKSIAARAAHTSAPQDIKHAAFGKQTSSTSVFVKTPGIVTYNPPTHGGRTKPEATPTAKVSKGSTPSYTHQMKGGGKLGATPLAFGGQSTPPPATAGGVMLYKKSDAPGAKATPVAMGQSKPPSSKPGGVMGGHAEEIELGDETFSFDPYKGFKRLAGLSDDRMYEMKNVADMDEDEVVAHAQSLAAQAVFSRHGKRRMPSMEAKRFKEAMQRIKDEGLLGDDDQELLVKKWNG